MTYTLFRSGASALGLIGACAVAQDVGFAIRVNGEPLTQDRRVTDVARKVDVALADADVQVVFDGLGAVPRLDMEIAGAPAGYMAGQAVTLQSALNYPAYVARAEFRLIDRTALGGARTVVVVPVTPNGPAQVVLPDGDLVVVHRVYDAGGRFDETLPLSLASGDRRANALRGVITTSIISKAS